jgi:hypothetical protein
MMPIGSEDILRLNLLAAIFTASAVGWLFKTILLVFRLNVFGATQPLSPSAVVSASVGALVLAFSSTWWSQAVAVEVYSLHLLFLSLLLYWYLRGIDEQKEQTKTLSPSLILFAFVLGLSFTNHMTTMLLAPALLSVYLTHFGLSRESWNRVLKLLPFFLLGLSLYLYLPVRATVQPPLNWGNPIDFERFIWHVTGKQYRSWMFTGFENAEKQFSYFLKSFRTEFHPLTFAPLLVGIFSVLHRSGRLFLFLALLFFGCLLYAINYEIHDIDSYFLLAYLAAGIVMTFGIHSIWTWLSSRFATRQKSWAWVILLVLPALQWWNNKELVDQSDNWLVHDYTNNIFDRVQPNALILTYQWDYFVASSYYQQLVKKRREDMIVVDKELLRRSWYLSMLERNYPQLVERSRETIDRFRAELYKFEHNLPYDPAVIEARYNEMINDLIDKAMEERPVYVGGEIEPQFAYSYQRVPDGLLFRLLRENETIAAQPLEVVFRPTSLENDYTRGIRFLYARMLTLNAALLREQAMALEALRTVERALRIDSTYRPARALREELLTATTSSPRP